MGRTPEIEVIGAGCAGLGLAAALAEAGLDEIHLVTKEMPANRPDHIWGFWGEASLQPAMRLARHHWPRWQIADETGIITHHSTDHAYHALQASHWLASCQARLDAHEDSCVIRQDEAAEEVTAAIRFDSRPPQLPTNVLYQHFLGQYVTSDRPIFDPGCALLMDFRCDQSQGMHFIYLLPFSETEALVESTLFTAEIASDEYYRTAITAYLSRFYASASFTITGEEKGALPLCEIAQTPKKNEIAIGARGGALRPSSGYGFVFIQRHITKLVRHYQQSGEWRPQAPHSPLQLWMDRVFLRVIEGQSPDIPSYFVRLASQLDGASFARFMSGRARWRDLAKVVWAMPPTPFLKAALSLLWRPARKGWVK